MARLWKIVSCLLITITSLGMDKPVPDPRSTEEKPRLYFSELPFAVGRLAILSAAEIPSDQRDNRQDIIIEQGQQMEKFNALANHAWKTGVDEEPFVQAALASISSDSKQKSYFLPNIFSIMVAMPGNPEQIKKRLLKLLQEPGQPFNRLSQADKDRLVVDTIKVCPCVEVIRPMIEAGAEVHSCDPQTLKNLLIYAAIADETELIAFLLDAGALPNVSDGLHYTPLHYAAANGSQTAVDLLLTHEAKPDLLNLDQNPPLFFAVGTTNIQLVSLLLKHGAQIYLPQSETNENDILTRNVLAIAAKNRSIPLLRILIEARKEGYLFDTQFEYMLNGALIRASEEGYADVLHFLLNLTKHIAFKPRERRPRIMPHLVINGTSAFTSALMHGHYSVAAQLQKYDDYNFLPSTFLSQVTSFMVALEKRAELDPDKPRTIHKIWLLDDLIEDFKKQFLIYPGSEVASLSICFKTACLKNIDLLELFINHYKKQDPLLPRKLLFHSAQHGHVDAIRSVLQTRLYFNEQKNGTIQQQVGFISARIFDGNGDTPLHKVVTSIDGARGSIINDLFACGADGTIKSSTGETPLHKALKHVNKKDQKKIVYQLLNGMSEVHRRQVVDEPDNTGLTPVMIAAGQHDKSHKIITYLFSLGATLDRKDNAGRTPLFIAVANNYLENVETLLNYGANPNEPNKSGCGPLVKAARHGNVAMINVLLKAGADLKRFANPMLRQVCKKGDKLIIKWLLRNGADIDGESTSYGDTPLHKAVAYRQLDVVRLLLKHGAGSKTNRKGQTPHDYAVKQRDPEITQLLVQAMGKNKFTYYQ